jgi:hypothetical protein
MPTKSLSVSQLNRALQIAEKIESLQAELDALLGGGGSSAASAAASAGETASTKSRGKGRRRGRRKGSKMSPEGRARIAEAQRKRWAKARAGK